MGSVQSLRYKSCLAKQSSPLISAEWRCCLPIQQRSNTSRRFQLASLKTLCTAINAEIGSQMYQETSRTRANFRFLLQEITSQASSSPFQTIVIKNSTICDLRILNPLSSFQCSSMYVLCKDFRAHHTQSARPQDICISDCHICIYGTVQSHSYMQTV